VVKQFFHSISANFYILTFFIVVLSNKVSFAQDAQPKPINFEQKIRIYVEPKSVPCASLITLPPQVMADIQLLLRDYRNTHRIHSPDPVPEATRNYYGQQMHIIELQYGFVVDWDTGGLISAEYTDDSPIPRDLSRSEVWAIWETVKKRADFALAVVQGSKNAHAALETMEGRLVACERRWAIRVNRQTGAILKVRLDADQ
jgi:hypothetical protein